MRRGNYGFDAPRVVAGLFLGSFALFGLAIGAFWIQSPLWFWVLFLYTFPTALAFLITACWMVYGIRCTKPRLLSEAIRDLGLRGDELVLDIGCGRGIVLCEVAKHLPCGKAHGIDLLSAKDQSGNRPEATLENARLEGVADRVAVHTGDARNLPFPDAMFDAVVSSLCLHNIPEKSERDKALRECVRVVKPGGRILLIDIQRGKEYASFLAGQGLSVDCAGPLYAYCPPLMVVVSRRI